MMDGNYFVGMHLFWWLLWIIFIFIIFGWFRPVPKAMIRRDSPFDILNRRLATGEITTEEYQEKKKILEDDLTKGAK